MVEAGVPERERTLFGSIRVHKQKELHLTVQPFFFCSSSRPDEDALSGKTYLLSGAGAGFGASGAGAAGLASGAGTGAGATGVAAGLGASAAGAGFASGAFGASAFFSAAGASAFFSAGAGAPPSQAANERATAEAARTEVICTFMVGDSGFGVEMCL